MGSKAVMFLCFCLAVVLMIASEVAARGLAEATSTSVETCKINSMSPIKILIYSFYFFLDNMNIM